MRRTIMTAVATVSLAAPSAALAHNGARHHHRHHGRHHHAHVLAFHAQAPAGSTSAPTSPGAPSSSSDSAGTIASFTSGVLTITLNDGSTVSGKVTERTEIECPGPTPAPSGPASFGEGEHGDDGHFDNSHDDWNSGNDGEGRGGCPGHEEGGGHCTSAALVPGASVKEAFLSVSNEGATWVKVEL